MSGNSYLGVGVSPSGNVPVAEMKKKIIDPRVAELVLRTLVCCLGLVAALLLATDTQVKEIFAVQKKAKFTDMKALVFLMVANGIAAAYSLLQILRSFLTGSVLFNKPLACLIFSVDQLMAYIIVAALGAAAQSAAFAKLGVPELQWMKVCDMYGKFCNQVGEGIAASVFVCGTIIIVSGMSAISLFRLYSQNNGSKTSAIGW